MTHRRKVPLAILTSLTLHSSTQESAICCCPGRSRLRRPRQPELGFLLLNGQVPRGSDGFGFVVPVVPPFAGRSTPLATARIDAVDPNLLRDRVAVDAHDLGG